MMYIQTADKLKESGFITESQHLEIFDTTIHLEDLTLKFHPQKAYFLL